MLAKAWRLESDIIPIAMWEDFALIEVASAVGRASIRTALAHIRLASAHTSELRLFQWACRVSLGDEEASDRLREAVERYQGDPLWPVLARHVARMSTSEDRALLEDLAARPEQRDAPVSWALRYYVRGDIVMRDGEVITVDEICDEIGLPRMPLLDDMPPEIDVDIDDGADADEDSKIPDLR